VRRSETLLLAHQAQVFFWSDTISIELSRTLLSGLFEPKALMLNLTWPESAFQLSYLAQFCASCLPTFSPFKSLHIDVSVDDTRQHAIDDPDPQCLELLRLFSAVMCLSLCKTVAPHVAQALRGLPVERVMEVLPALRSVFISGLEPSGLVREAISEFADARKLSGHHVFIQGREVPSHHLKQVKRGYRKLYRDSSFPLSLP